MMKAIAAVVFALALTASAQAMPLASIQRPDKMVTKVAEACGVGMHRVGGVCVPRCAVGLRWVGGRCIR